VISTDIMRGVCFCLISLSLQLFLISCSRPELDDATLMGIAPQLGMALENGAEFTLRKNVLREGQQRVYRTIEAHRGDCVLKIEMIGGIDEESAASHIEERKLLIGTLFESVPSPYPGVISHTIAVTNESALKIVTARVQGQTEEIYLLPSNDRFTYGPLEEDLIRYRGGVMFHYERDSQSLYRLDLFVPREAYEEGEALALFASMRFRRRIEFKMIGRFR